MRKNTVIIFLLGLALFYTSCNSGGNTTSTTTPTTTSETPAAAPADTKSYDPNRGEGKFDESNVQLGALDAAMASKGKAISEAKCFSCHKTSDERLVGPGWKGVTERRKAPWIMNFITNPDAMIDKDPEVQAQLEICLVRMPNQNLAETEAREILEFMRQNDGAK